MAELLDTIRQAQASGALTLDAAPSPVESPISSKMLTDRFGRTHTYLRISLTERCNLRCTYCMPAEGVALTPSNELLTTAEVQRLLRLFVQAGVTKLRFTGGEPTVRADLVDIIASAATLRPQGLDAICITSNGLVLARKLPALVAAGLTHVNISLDTLDPLQFELLTRRPAAGYTLVRRGIDEALRLVGEYKAAQARGEHPTRGLRSIKLNCVIIKGINDSQILDFVSLTRDSDLEVRFIEYMPFDGNRWASKKMMPYQDMVERIRGAHPSFARQAAEPNETSKTWAVPGWKGRVGFISSMSDHFCSTCNRLRLTADGQLKVCLFGANEVSLRDAMRMPLNNNNNAATPQLDASAQATEQQAASAGCSDEDLALIVAAAVQKKKAQHAGMTTIAATKNRPMITIGG